VPPLPATEATRSRTAQRRRDLVGDAAGALDDEQRPAARHALEQLRAGARATAGEHHRNRRALRELFGERHQQRRLAAPLVAVGEHDVAVVTIQRRAPVAERAGVLDPAGRRDAEQDRHRGRVASALLADQRHHPGGGAAVDDRRPRQRRGRGDRGTERAARDRQLRLGHVVGAAADDDPRPRRRGEARTCQQRGGALAGPRKHHRAGGSWTHVAIIPTRARRAATTVATLAGRSRVVVARDRRR
jgi:hypothetical protein